MSLDRYDALALVGLGLLACGAALMYAPLGLMVLGAGLLAAGLLGARSENVAPSGKIDDQPADGEVN